VWAVLFHSYQLTAISALAISIQRLKHPSKLKVDVRRLLVAHSKSHLFTAEAAEIAEERR
jgi:hypothetical protein